MSDLRARLADALRDQLLALHPQNQLTAGSVGGNVYLASPLLDPGRLADTLLSLPGIAIVAREALASVIKGGIQSYAETYALQKLNDDAESITEYIFTNALLSAAELVTPQGDNV